MTVECRAVRCAALKYALYVPCPASRTLPSAHLPIPRANCSLKSCTIDDHDAETSTPLRHLKLCKPHCISCYWDLRCGPKRWEKYTRSPDHQRLCHVTEPVGSRSTSMSRPGTYYYGAAPRQPATTRICRLCLDRPVELRRRVVEVGDKEAAGLAWRGRLECAACREPLGRWSLVWWVCSWCGGDCADGIHPLTGNRKQ